VVLKLACHFSRPSTSAFAHAVAHCTDLARTSASIPLIPPAFGGEALNAEREGSVRSKRFAGGAKVC
jgi:hypothetical protein